VLKISERACTQQLTYTLLACTQDLSAQNLRAGITQKLTYTLLACTQVLSAQDLSAGMHSRADVHFAGMHSRSQCSKSQSGHHSKTDVHFAGMHSSSQCSRSQCRHALKSRRTLCWHALNISMLKISVRACTQDLSAQNLSAGMHTKGDRHFAAKLTHYKWFQDKHAWLVNFTLLHRPQKSAKLGHEERFF